MNLSLRLSVLINNPSINRGQKSTYTPGVISQKLSPISYSEYKNLPLPKDMEHVKHTVKTGETIESIAKLYNLSPVQLLECLKDEEGKEEVYPGQEIIIPTLAKKKVIDSA